MTLERAVARAQQISGGARSKTEQGHMTAGNVSPVMGQVKNDLGSEPVSFARSKSPKVSSRDQT